jgi:hypothetical protein
LFVIARVDWAQAQPDPQKPYIKYVQRYELTLRTISGPPEPEQFVTVSPYMCADPTKNSGCIALFDGADHLDLASIANLGLDANLPIAHRITDFSPWHASLARTICIVLNIFGNKFDMMPACKHGCMFVGALHFSRTLP